MITKHSTNHRLLLGAFHVRLLRPSIQAGSVQGRPDPTSPTPGCAEKMGKWRPDQALTSRVPRHPKLAESCTTCLWKHRPIDITDKQLRPHNSRNSHLQLHDVIHPSSTVTSPTRVISTLAPVSFFLSHAPYCSELQQFRTVQLALGVSTAHRLRFPTGVTQSPKIIQQHNPFVTLYESTFYTPNDPTNTPYDYNSICHCNFPAIYPSVSTVYIIPSAIGVASIQHHILFSSYLSHRYK